jgi:hypothetical protein
MINWEKMDEKAAMTMFQDVGTGGITLLTRTQTWGDAMATLGLVMRTIMGVSGISWKNTKGKIWS